MDPHTARQLTDKVYDKRKLGALAIEEAVRKAKQSGDFDKIEKIIDKLCADYAYAVHQPYARNGGLIGLAAASIALEQDVAPYLDKIIPPVLACFGDQDARVRYYACESMYNIAKTCKGELLPWFNEIFDALAKLSADAEASVKNGAELLDRLIKDIISTSATSYVSVLQTKEHPLGETLLEGGDAVDPRDLPTAFNLPRFIPLLQERILVINPWTRMFLVQWIRLLDEIPDLELVVYLPSFLGGLFQFLKDTNQDVVVATQQVLDNFLKEIKLVAKVKRKQENSKSRETADDASVRSPSAQSRGSNDEASRPGSKDANQPDVESAINQDYEESNSIVLDSSSENDLDENISNEEWTPGQGVQIEHAKILEILITFVRATDETVQLTALRWIDSLFDICANEILSFVPSLLNKVLPALSSDIETVQQVASSVNTNLMDYVERLPDELSTDATEGPQRSASPNKSGRGVTQRESVSTSNIQGLDGQDVSQQPSPGGTAPSVYPTAAITTTSLDYESSVNSLTLQFLNEHEVTRVAALSWLIMLQQKAPQKVLAAHDGSFPALLKTLSDPSDAVVTRDLQLLCQISKNSDDSYFTFFMVNLLKLFCTDRRLLEARGSLVIRHLCNTLGPERIYRIMADCLEKDEDVEFASVMVQNLNNILITAPELADLRRKLRNWDSRDGQTLFVTLFRSWCHNAVATISLCLLAQAYEQVYNLLQIFAEVEMTVAMLIQIDKLVQLLESPVFVYLRLQLLEPEKYPHLYKCLYGILMLLPQSAAFAALKNRLNSVSAIGYLHVPSSVRPGAAASSSASSTASRIKPPSRPDDSTVKWPDLLDKFKATQERARRASRSGGSVPPYQQPHQQQLHHAQQLSGDGLDALDGSSAKARKLLGPADGMAVARRSEGGADGKVAPGAAAASALVGGVGAHKSRLSASHFGRLAIGVKSSVGKGKK